MDPILLASAIPAVTVLATALYRTQQHVRPTVHVTEVPGHAQLPPVSATVVVNDPPCGYCDALQRRCACRRNLVPRPPRTPDQLVESLNPIRPAVTLPPPTVTLVPKGRKFSMEEIENMSMEEYARYRQELFEWIDIQRSLK